jgi:hypothetical protein
MVDSDAVNGLLALNPDKPVSLPGRKCVYCGCDLERRSSTQDHVVGRRFVPEGTLATGFFLQVKACRRCNDRKAALEDDISLITMLPDTAGAFARDDDRLRRAVERKSRGSISPATRRLVAQSYNQINTRIPVGNGVALTYNALAMPAIADQRLAELAYYHVQGFFSFRSFDRERGYGRWLERNKFLLLGSVVNSDWGNPRLRHVMAQMNLWEPTFLGILADGYFRHEMRKDPASDLSAWVLEWNNRLRLFGLYGPDGQRDAFVAEMPSLNLDFSYGDTTNGFAMRYDVALPEDEDTLFMVPAGYHEQPTATPHWR